MMLLEKLLNKIFTILKAIIDTQSSKPTRRGIFSILTLSDLIKY